MKTAISLPDTLFRQAERLARTLGISCSQLYLRALRAFVDRYDPDAITARLDAVYGSELSGVDPALMRLQARSLESAHW